MDMKGPVKRPLSVETVLQEETNPGSFKGICLRMQNRWATDGHPMLRKTHQKAEERKTGKVIKPTKQPKKMLFHQEQRFTVLFNQNWQI